MEQALDFPQIFESSRGRRRRGPDRQTWQSSGGGQGPWRPTRRQAIATALGALGLIALGKRITEGTQPPTQPVETPQPIRSPYRDWERFQNLPLPRETIIAIGEDIEKSKYQGFPEVGKIIVISQTRPEALSSYLPGLEGHGQVTVSFTSLMQSIHSLADLNFSSKYYPVDVEVHDKQTGDVRKHTFRHFVSHNIQVRLDNGVAFAPEAAKKLLLVKEFCHFLYFQQQRDLIAAQVLSRYDIDVPGIADMATFLLFNGQVKESTPHIPSLSDSFDNALVDIDGAGYYHITPMFGQMQAEGLFSQRDLISLESNNDAFKAARKAGILLSQSRQTFVWKESIGPFSPEWTSILRPILRGSQ